MKSKAPKGEQWLHEIKLDGYRVQVRVNKSMKKVHSRNGADWTRRYSQIAGPLDIPGEAIIDRRANGLNGHHQRSDNCLAGVENLRQGHRCSHCAK